MKRNSLKIYSVVVTVAAALLMLAVIILLYKVNPGNIFNRTAVIDVGNSVVQAGDESEEAAALAGNENPDGQAAAQSGSGEQNIQTSDEYGQEESTSVYSTGKNEGIEDGDKTDRSDKDKSGHGDYSSSNKYNAGDIVAEANDEETGHPSEYILTAWSNMLEKLDFDADVVFYGDSLIQRSDFRHYFPDKKILNLGLGGEKIAGALARCDVLGIVKPKKIFIMVGVNELRNETLEKCEQEYVQMLDRIKAIVPDSKIYTTSLLPMVAYMQDYLPCASKTTEEFNSFIKESSDSRGIVFVDLYPLFVKDNELNPDYSLDGVHINEAGYNVWAKEIKKYVEDK